MLRILTPWDSQPQEAVGLDPHWISRGLIFLSLGNGVYWTQERGFFGAVNTVSGAPRISASSVGLVTGFGATSGAGTTDRLDVGTVYMGAVAFRSIVAWVYPRGTGGGGLGRVFQPVGSSGSDTVPGESLFINTVNNIKLTYGRSTTSTTQTAGITGSITLNAWSCFGFTHNQTGAVGAVPTCYENGAANSSVTTNGVAAGAFNTSPYTLSLGNRSTDNARNWDGQLGPIAIFDNSVGLTANEHAALFANFWQLFAPRSIWVPVSVGGGSASTITAAAGASTASTLAASSTAASTPTAAAGTATASTVAASSTAATAITSATGAATASTLTGSAVVARAITAAAGVGAASTVAATSTAASAITQATGSATASTMVGTGLTAGASAIMPATGAATASTMTGAATAAAAITPAAGVATGQTLVPASTVSSASMTPAAGAASAATFAASAVAASVAIAAAGASSAQVMAATAQAVAAINAAAGTSVCSTLANADAAIVVLGSLAGSTRKPGAIRSNVQTAVRSNRQTAKR